MLSSLSALKNLQFKNRVLFKTAFVQLLFLCLASVFLAYVLTFQAASSFLLGGLVSIVPALLFGKIYFKKRSVRAARSILNAFYIGEALKLLVTTLLFAIIFLQKNVLAGWVFSGYITALLVYFLLLIRFIDQK